MERVWPESEHDKTRVRANPHLGLSGPWCGTTSFQLVQRCHPRPGFYYLSGREQPIRIIKTERPEEVMPELWTRLTKPMMQQCIDQWKINKPKRDAARVARGLTVPFPLDRTEERRKLILKVQDDLKHALAPAMPLVLDRRLSQLSSISTAINSEAPAPGNPC